MSAVPTSTAPFVAPDRRRHLHLVPSGPAQQAERVEAGMARRPRSVVFARRRFAALVVLLVLAAGAVFATKAIAGSSVVDGAVTVTVHNGETLSDVAAREMPSIRTDRAVVRLQELNNLNSMHVEAGQQLLVPAS